MNKNYENFVGIDISKNTLDYCFVINGEKKFTGMTTNNTQGLNIMEKELKKKGIIMEQVLFCFEHTGMYTNHLKVWISINSYHAWIESPIAIKKSMGLQRGKNDQIDAFRIALYAFRFQQECKEWQAPREAVKKLGELDMLRKKLIKQKVQLEVSLKEYKTFSDKNTQKMLGNCTKDALKGIIKSLEKVEKEIEATIAQDEQLNTLVDLITSVDGVGVVTAIALILATNEFKDINEPSKIASLVGIAPFEHSSGTSVRGRNRVSHFARKPLKSLLHMCAVTAIRNSEEMTEFYQRKLKEGKHKMSILNAVRNKLLYRICACVRKGRKYEKTYMRKLA